MEKYGKDPIDDHDRPARPRPGAPRMAMRHFGPPHSPHVIPDMEPECVRIVNDMLDKAKGKTRIDVVDDYAYPLPIAVICRIMGVPREGRTPIPRWIADMMAGAELGPDAATEEGKRRMEKGRKRAASRMKKYYDRASRERREKPH